MAPIRRRPVPGSEPSMNREIPIDPLMESHQASDPESQNCEVPASRPVPTSEHQGRQTSIFEQNASRDQRYD